jgi:hypothetical protein
VRHIFPCGNDSTIRLSWRKNSGRWYTWCGCNAAAESGFSVEFGFPMDFLLCTCLVDRIYLHILKSKLHKTQLAPDLPERNHCVCVCVCMNTSKNKLWFVLHKRANGNTTNCNSVGEMMREPVHGHRRDEWRMFTDASKVCIKLKNSLSPRLWFVMLCTWSDHMKIWTFCSLIYNKTNNIVNNMWGYESHSIATRHIAYFLCLVSVSDVNWTIAQLAGTTPW